MEYIKLNDGNKIPSVGFGVFLIPADGSTYNAVRYALDAGYRHIDTAMAYYNEAEVGKAVKDSGIPREDIFITSKLWLDHFGYERAVSGIERSLRLLDSGYIDLYLIHQPYGDVSGAWKAMEQAQAEGKIKSLGVSNMSPNIWNSFVPDFNIKPTVNQVECNPFFMQKPLRDIMEAYNTKIECWAPLGQGNTLLLQNETVLRLAKKYSKDAGQIILRYELQEGCIVLPKSVHENRIKSNLNLFDFTLDSDDMEAMRKLDKGHGRHNPDAEGVAQRLLNNYKIED